MFEALRVAFRQAVQNFHEELNRAPAPVSEEGVFASMVREIEAATAKVDELRRGLRATEAEAAEEEKLLQTCRRRQEQAKTIGDLETARVSGEFMERHRRRGEILSDKVSILAREIEEWERELYLMWERYRQERLSWDRSQGGLVEP